MFIENRGTPHVWTLRDAPGLEQRYGRRYEIMAGSLILHEAPGFHHGTVAARIILLLYQFIEEHSDIGYVVSEVDCILFRNPDTIFRPDVAFIRKERIPSPTSDEFFEGAPDLVIEVTSPRNTKSAIEEKIAVYIAAGTKLVWQVDSANEEVIIQRADGTRDCLTSNDTITGEDVIPGWICMVERLFRRAKGSSGPGSIAQERVGGWPPS